MAAVCGPQPGAPPCAWPNRELENDSAPDFARTHDATTPSRPRIPSARGSPKKLFGERILANLICVAVLATMFTAERDAEAPASGQQLFDAIVCSTERPRVFRRKRAPQPPMACQRLTSNCISTSSLATKPHVVKQRPSNASYGSIISFTGPDCSDRNKLMRRSKAQWLREASLYRSPHPHEQREAKMACDAPKIDARNDTTIAGTRRHSTQYLAINGSLRQWE